MLAMTIRKLRAASLAGLAALSLAAAGPALAQEKAVKIGWTAWADAEAITHVAKNILETRMGYKVDLVMTDIALQFQGIAKGQLDMMMMCWLPVTHKAYYDKVKDELVDLGIVYDGAKIGWAVPEYVPVSAVKSFPDLNKPEVKAKLKNQIQGIDPGAGMMGISKKAIAEYPLTGYELLTASDAAMNVALDRAVARNEWIVVLTWTPHWMHSKHKLRYLDDPKNFFGGAEDVHALGRKGLDKDHAAVVKLIKNMKMPLAELQGIMFKASQKSTSEKEAAAWVKANPAIVDKWLAGVMK